MDIQYDLPKADVLRKRVGNGQRVIITRLVTIVYEVDMSEFLEDMDESDISVEDLIQHEVDNNTFSVEMEYSAETDITDDTVISVEIH